MTYVITQPCEGVKDGACIDACPVDCIEGTPDTPMLYIDPEVCVDCAACTSVCPVDAIYYDAEVPQEWKHYLKINADYFGRADGADDQ
jgi:ferredoxin